MAFNPSLLLCLCTAGELLPRGPSEGKMALTDEERALFRVAKDGLGIIRGDTGDTSDGDLLSTTTSFSSKNTGMLASEPLLLTGFFDAASLARFPSVGTRGPEPGFLISVSLAVPGLATMELLLLASLGICGTGGERPLAVPEGVVEPDLTLTMLAC